MKTLISLLVAAGLLSTAYWVAFGVPQFMANDTAQAATDTTTRNARAGAGSGRGGATTVVMATLEAAPYSHILRSIGSAKSSQSTTLVSVGSGEVTSSSLLANSRVEVGEILLQLDSSTEALELEIAEAELQQARSTVARYENAGGGTVAQMTLQDARAAAQVASGNVKLLQLALQERTIRAPIAGRLGLSSIARGDYLAAGDEIVTIDNTDKLIAQFEVPERAVALVKRGASVLVNTPVLTGRTFNGTVTAFDSRLDDVTRSITVEAEIDNADNRLWSGMTFAVRMINETDQLPVVPSTAITWNRNGAGIWSVRDGAASRHPVTILYRQGNSVWIESDQPLGSVIVTEGAQKLRQGSKVQQAAEAPTVDIVSNEQNAQRAAQGTDT